jgi:hypothetical protein
MSMRWRQTLLLAWMKRSLLVSILDKPKNHGLLPINSVNVRWG